jgi:DNA-binding response OmpR family regulator
MKILVVEDEDALARGLVFNFEQEGYDVLRAADGRRALELFDEAATANGGRGRIDCVVLDLMLPGQSGYDICRELRNRDERVPILVLSARSLAEDKAQAFDCGTDQYMTKPFDLRELLSRVQNLIKRRLPDRSPQHKEPGETVRRFGDVTVDFETFEVTVAGEVHTLTTLEMKLLRYFVDHEGRVLPRTEILDRVWGNEANVTTRTIDNFVMRLRKILDTSDQKESHIRSVRGTGYRFFGTQDDVTD